jgi:hypothetical protein
MPQSKEIIKCNICGELLEHKEYWAKEHLKEYPEHRDYKFI